MANKPFYKSKTIWVNVIVAIGLGILGIDIGVDPEIELIGLALVNLGLRFITKEGISF